MNPDACLQAKDEALREAVILSKMYRPAAYRKSPNNATWLHRFEVSWAGEGITDRGCLTKKLCWNYQIPVFPFVRPLHRKLFFQLQFSTRQKYDSAKFNSANFNSAFIELRSIHRLRKTRLRKIHPALDDEVTLKIAHLEYHIFQT